MDHLPAEDSGEQIILEEEIDEHYEPNDEEIKEYAQWLGMDVEQEQDLLWIARDGLKAPLPAEWKPCKTPTGEIYYFNFSSGESIWDHPCDGYYRKLYQQEKERRQQQHQPQQQQQHQAQHQQQQQQQQQQQLQQHQQQQQQPGQSPAQQAQGSLLGLSSSSAQQQVDNSTRVEPWRPPASSPSGTLSTVPSIMTASMPPSPAAGLPLAGAGGLSRDVSSRLATPTLSRVPSSSMGTPLVPVTGLFTAVGSSGPGGGSGDDWRGQERAADTAARAAFRGMLSEERSRWEASARAEAAAQHSALLEEQEGSLWRLRRGLEERQAAASAALQQELTASLQAARAAAEAQHAAQLDQLAGRQRDALAAAEAQHAAAMAALKQQQAGQLEAALADLAAATQRLSSGAALGEDQVAGVRAAALGAAREEAAAEAAALKRQLMEEARARVEKEVSAQLGSLRSSQQVAALQGLGAQVEGGLVAATGRLEGLTTQLAGLEEAVATKAATLQALADKEAQAQRTAAATANNQATAAAQLAATNAALAGARGELAQMDELLAGRRSEAAAVELRLAEAGAAAAAAAGQSAAADVATSQAAQRVARLNSEEKVAASELALAREKLAAATGELSRRQVALADVEAALGERRAQLAAAGAELAKRRSALVGPASGLSDALRRQTDAQVAAAEERLVSTKANLSAAEAQLMAQQATLAGLNAAVAGARAQLAGLEERATAKHGELEALAAAAGSAAAQQYSASRNALHQEEVQLLEVGRAALGARVAGQLEALAAAQLAAGRAALDVRLAAEQRSALAAARQAQVSQWLLEQDGLHDLALRGSRDTSGFPGPAMGAEALGGAHGAEARSTAAPDASPLRLALAVSPSAAALATAADALQRSLEAAQAQAAAAAAAATEAGRDEDGQAANIVTRHSSSGSSTEARPPPLQVPTVASEAELGAVAVAAGEHAAPAVSCQHSEAAGGVAGRPASVRAALGLVAVARTWLRGQRGVLKDRQAALLEAQAEWRRALAAWEGPAAAGGVAGGEGGAPGSSAAGGGRAEALAGLRCLKAVLQDQVHTLNADARTLRRLKEQVRELERCLPPGPGGRQTGTGAQLAPHSALGLAPAAATNAWLAGQGAPRTTTTAAAAAAGGAWGRPWAVDGGAPPLEGPPAGVAPGPGPLERMAAALEEALAAAAATPASSHQPAGTSTPALPAAAPAAMSSTRYQAAAPAARSSPANGVAASQQQGAAGQWKAGQNAAAGLLQKHSQWLNDFRGQIARFSGPTAPGSQVAAPGPAAGPSCGSLTQQPSSNGSLPTPGAGAMQGVAPLSAAALLSLQPGTPPANSTTVAGVPLLPVASLSCIGSEVGLGEQPAGPVRLDLGGNQELLISLVTR